MVLTNARDISRMATLNEYLRDAWRVNRDTYDERSYGQA